METFTWPMAITLLGGLFTLSFLIVRVVQEMKSKDEWKNADAELDKRVARIEHVQKNVVKAFEDLKDVCDVSEIEQRIATIEANHQNLVKRTDELRHGQEKLDGKIEKLTDLMIRYLSEN